MIFSISKNIDFTEKNQKINKLYFRLIQYCLLFKKTIILFNISQISVTKRDIEVTLYHILLLIILFRMVREQNLEITLIITEFREFIGEVLTGNGKNAPALSEKMILVQDLSYISHTLWN